MRSSQILTELTHNTNNNEANLQDLAVSFNAPSNPQLADNALANDEQNQATQAKGTSDPTAEYTNIINPNIFGGTQQSVLDGSYSHTCSVAYTDLGFVDRFYMYSKKRYSNQQRINIIHEYKNCTSIDEEKLVLRKYGITKRCIDRWITNYNLKIGIFADKPIKVQSQFTNIK